MRHKTNYIAHTPHEKSLKKKKSWTPQHMWFFAWVPKQILHHWWEEVLPNTLPPMISIVFRPAAGGKFFWNIRKTLNLVVSQWFGPSPFPPKKYALNKLSPHVDGHFFVPKPWLYPNLAEVFWNYFQRIYCRNFFNIFIFLNYLFFFLQPISRMEIIIGISKLLWHPN